jgi:short-subunit dehydrogenase
MPKNRTPSLKPLHEQVIVITGASSGIGLATARLAAKQGASLVLAARSGNALKALEREINEEMGGEAVAVSADVGNEKDIKKIADTAIREFGGFDTWINNAGASIYGYMEDVPLEDMRRLFETNFWGVVMGSLEAVKHLKQRGGALINLGSTLSDRAIPVQGMYSASKHAVKGFTDALRMEVEERHYPISVTLIKPGAIDTPFTVNAKNYLDSTPQHPAPVYEPHAAAVAILHCAQTATRDVFVGWGGKQQSLMGKFAPRMADLMMERMLLPATLSGMPKSPIEDNGLERPTERLTERGNYPGNVAASSLYTRASLHPYLLMTMLAGAGLAATAMMGSWDRRSRVNARQDALAASRNGAPRLQYGRASPARARRRPAAGRSEPAQARQ